jgi:hypothetical protein
VTALLAGGALLLAAPVPLAAQEVDAMPMPLSEVSLGYMFMSRETTGESERFPRGWYVSMAANVSPWFSIVGEGTGSYRSDATRFMAEAVVQDEAFRRREYTLMAGPRLYHKVRRVVPFAQVLAGIALQRVEQSTTVSGEAPWVGQWRTERQTNLFTLQPGGGLGILLTDRLGARVAADYRALFDVGDDAVFHEFRVLTGLTFHWGTR